LTLFFLASRNAAAPLALVAALVSASSRASMFAANVASEGVGFGKLGFSIKALWTPLANVMRAEFCFGAPRTATGVDSLFVLMRASMGCDVRRTVGRNVVELADGTTGSKPAPALSTAG
jgi:hypothetical protein